MSRTSLSSILSLLLCLAPLISKAQLSFSLLPAAPADNYPSVAVDPTIGDIYAMNYIRVMRSTDGGATWTALHNTGIVTGLNVIYFTASGQLYLGGAATIATPQVGLERYNKSTDTWTPVTGAPLNVTALTTDNSGNLIVGTGTTGNFNPNPVNYGSGIYSYNGSSWTAISTGIPTLANYSSLPYIKAFAKTGGGTLLAATYGCGVLQYSGSAWSAYGSGLGDMNVSSLAVSSGGTVFAGCDSLIAGGSGGAWTSLNTGLPKKPVRALKIDGTGKIYAGLGFYQWMDGALRGNIYTSVNSGASWQNSTGNYASSDVLSLAIDAANTVYLGSTGVHKSGNGGASWTAYPITSGGGGQVTFTVKTSYGALFSICDNYPQYSGYGGIFRSLDGGVTWQQVINGIQRHRGDMLFCDSHDHIWAGFSTLDNLATNGSHRHAALYESTDTGVTWVQNTSIMQPSLTFNCMAETSGGKLYLSSGWGAPTDISSSVDSGATWANNLNGTGGDGFNCAVNAAGDVFIGGENGGVMRSTSNGAANSFSTIASGGPTGNCSVFVDPNTQYVFATGQGGPNPALHFYGSATNGTTMFPMNGLPTYTSPTTVVFDNRGNMYASCASAVAANTGLWKAGAPWDSTTVFSRVMANANLSYNFNSVMIDACGYIYGTARGAGVLRSAFPVNTPAAAMLQSPLPGATGVSLTPALAWAHRCAPDSFRLEIAADSLFAVMVLDSTLAAGYSLSPRAGLLSSSTTYYWRLRAINKAGIGAWSAASRFTTAGTPLPLQLSRFSARVQSPQLVQLYWETGDMRDVASFGIARSADAKTFVPVGSVSAQASQASYSFSDEQPLAGTSWYRLCLKRVDGGRVYSPVEKVCTGAAPFTQLTPQPAHDHILITSNDGRLLQGGAVLTDIQGRALLLIPAIRSGMSIGMQGLPAGMYFLKCSGGAAFRVVRE